MKRRDFLRQAALLGAAAVAGRGLLPRLLAVPSASAPIKEPAGGSSERVETRVAAVHGQDAFAAALRAVEWVGGIGRQVKAGSRVGLLINAPNWWRKPGSFTSPDIVLAVVQLCLDAGASDIVYVIDPGSGYWDRTPLGAKYPKLTAAVRHNPGEWAEVEIPRGVALKKAKVNRVALDCDTLINLPITKHHAGTGYSGCLKNFMGACHRDTNQYFHNGSGAKGEYDDVSFLSQCIADVNLVRPPDLHVADSTEFLLTNGPAGPGELKRADKVLAGTNAVSTDAYGCTLLGLTADKVAMIVRAAAHGLGEMDLAKIAVQEGTL